MRKIKNFAHKLEAIFASLILGCPAYKMTVIGVTGTDGKTTTVSLIYHLLKTAGYKVGMISTVGAKIDEKDIPIGLHTTTPSPFLIQKIIKKMYQDGCQFVIIEVTSHAIDQKRILGCNFQIGVLTNITHEHLDYHKNYDSYLKTKVNFLIKCPIAILNKDDESFDKIKYLLGNKNIFTYGIKNNADVIGKDVIIKENRQEFIVKGKMNDRNLLIKINSSLIGEYNVLNSLAAISVAVLLKVPSEKIVLGFNSFKSVKGRMEVIINNPYKIIVDFAHTPNAFKEILTTIKNMTKGKIIHIFGATGKRDITKRPLMGEISGKMADICILTSEDTYGEAPSEIILDIEKGIKKTNKIENKTYFKIIDREEAIKKAISLAKEGDTIIITGVGHQESLNMGHYELPWNDAQKIRQILNA